MPNPPHIFGMDTLKPQTNHPGTGTLSTNENKESTRYRSKRALLPQNLLSKATSHVLQNPRIQPHTHRRTMDCLNAKGIKTLCGLTQALWRRANPHRSI